ncbi:MAG: VanW family protein [Phormidesmis sp.]
MPFSTTVRRTIPLPLRQEVKHHLRRLDDAFHQIHFTKATGHFTAHPPIQLVQPVRHSAFYENKIINITRGAALLNKSLIPAHQHWSFWHRLHRPDAANGFVAGRNLVNGQLVAQTGGGLCQLSSMVYHLALLSGLSITERHAHSIDIYAEEQRYTPLGADATVVWGFKDLRLYNPHSFGISIGLAVQNGELHGEVSAEQALVALPVEFVRVPLREPLVEVRTVVGSEVKATTVYEQQQGLKAKTA